MIVYIVSGRSCLAADEWQDEFSVIASLGIIYYGCQEKIVTGQ